MTGSSRGQGRLAGFLGAAGRQALAVLRTPSSMLEHVSGIVDLTGMTLGFVFVAPFQGRVKLARQLFPMMSNVGVRSLPIVTLISALIGAILVLQTADVMQQYGQIQEVPGLVALSMTRELGPLMTAIIMTARVGASFTAVLASMKINEEVMALETMAIHPVGYLVAPRFLSMVVMMPCLAIIANLVGMVGGALVAWGKYDIAFSVYVEKTVFYLDMDDIYGGLLKACVFSMLITMICCYYGLTTRGGPMGLGRNTMVAVVTSLVVVIFADAILTAFVIGYMQ